MMREGKQDSSPRNNLSLSIDNDVEIGESSSSISSEFTEAQVVLLCLDHLRSLRRSCSTEDAMASIHLDGNFISLAIFALTRSFLPSSNLQLNDPYMSDREEDEEDSVRNDILFDSSQTTLPNLKSIERSFLTKEEYIYDDSHRSNDNRFFRLNGLASGSSTNNKVGPGGPISLQEIVTVGLAGLGADSRVGAETSMTRGALFEQFFTAVKEKGFFKDTDGNQMQEDSIAYAERYRKVVSKFRSKLAYKAEKALAVSSVQATQIHPKAMLSPNSISIESSPSMGHPHGYGQGYDQRHQFPIPSSSPRSTHAQHIHDSHINERDLKEAEILKNQGNQYMQAKSYKKAIESYTAALTVLPAGPSSHVYFSNRAAAFLSLKQYDEAIHDSERSLALKPDYAKAYSRLGLAHFLIEEYEDAIDAYTLSLKYEPDHESSKDYLEKAKQKLRSRQRHEGNNNSNTAKNNMNHSSLEQSREFQHQNPEYDDNRQRFIDQKEADNLKVEGNNFMSHKKYQQAVDCYSAAIALCPSGPSSHVYYSNRAAALCYLQRYAEGERDSELSLELNPGYGKAHARLGLSRFFLEDFEGAVEAYKTALKIDPNNTACVSYLAKAEKILSERQKNLNNQDMKTRSAR